MKEYSLVTGATGYTGYYIAERLLRAGKKVKSLTGHAGGPHSFGDEVEFIPYDFEHPHRIVESLKNVDVFYNTYWIRFPHSGLTFETAIQNTKILIDAAKAAGVRKFVHISVSNPDEQSSLPYFQGKAKTERLVMNSGLSFAIVRPTVIFGKEDILINNIAWFLRRFPVFAIAGSGAYQLQPVSVEDVADLCIRVASGNENVIIDAAGPDVFTYDEFVRLIAKTVGSNTKIIYLNPRIVLMLGCVLGCFLRDVILTKEELEGLMRNLLVSKNPPTGKKRFIDWLKDNQTTVGSCYSSELNRHFLK